jgi:hypothetical protein
MLSTSELKCKLLWKLCRKHGWGSPIPKTRLVNLALQSSSQGKGKRLVEELVQEPYIEYQEGQGYSALNNPDSQAQAAYRLNSSCGFLKIQIEPTLSRFEQAGGFDAYDEDDVLATLDDW